jgi:hypothetical protein
MKKLIYLLIIFTFFELPFSAKCQDFIRVGLGLGLNKKQLIQNFSFDFNRTKKIEEGEDRFLLYNVNDIYILPNADINIGEGISTSENNITFQMNSGKAFMGNPTKHGLTTSVWNEAIEFNPSYNSDKSFDEKLIYGQFKLIATHKIQKNDGIEENPNIVHVFFASPSLFLNLGYRNSKTFSMDKLYSTAGLALDLKARFRNLDSIPYDDWIVKLNFSYSYLISELSELTTDKYAGLLKLSVSKRITDRIYIGINYLYGNDNPFYEYVHSADLSFKIKY